MDLNDVILETKWDSERLGELSEPLKENGAEIAKSVVSKVGVELASCSSDSVNGLTTYLNGRDLLNLSDVKELSKPDATGDMLSSRLSLASTEKKGRGKDLIRDLYLSLLDLCQDRGDAWAYSVAFDVRKEAIMQLGLSHHLFITQQTDFSVVNHDFEVPLSASTATNLLQHLNIEQHSITEGTTNLKSLLEECCRQQKSLFDVVRAMMVTSGVGRHVSRLLPFYQSYPLEMLRFLRKLGKQWEKFAKFIGFTEDEVKRLKSSAPTVKRQIRNFSKVCRMPDLTSEKNKEVLELTLHEAGIDTDEDTSEAEATGATPIKCDQLVINVRANTMTSDISPHLFSRRNGNMASDRHSAVNERVSVQETGYGDDSTDRDSQPPIRQLSARAAPNDVNESLSISSHYERPSSSSEPMSYTSHPTSAPALPSTLDTDPQVMPTVRTSTAERPTFCKNDSFLAKSSLGMGLYGEVHVFEHNGKEYAAKRYHHGFTDMANLESMFTKKLIGLDHPNIVPYFGVCHLKCDTRQLPVVVMEKLGTNLATFLETHQPTQETKRSFLRNIAKGLAYLHAQDIIHCDLTAQNVLVTAQSTAKIADCGNGYVKTITDMETLPTDSSCLNYLPEEALGDDYDSSVDVFAFGHLSVYIVLQRNPRSLLSRKYRRGGHLFPRTELERRKKYIEQMSDKVSETILYPLVEFTKRCLSDDAEERPPITELESILCIQ